MHILNAIPVLHNGVFMAIIAHGLIGITLLWDKVLLKRQQTRNLLSYVFWLGAISIFGLLLIPFGFKMPSAGIIALAMLTGVVNLVAAFFYFAALKAGEASQALAIVGGFSPIATALIGIPLLRKQLSGDALVAFALLSAGGFVMFLSERIELGKMLPRILLAAGTLGLVNVLEKVVFDSTGFVTGYVFFTIGTFVGAMAMLVPVSWRQQIFRSSGEAAPRSKFFYLFNRFLNGVGSFLIFYAISLTNPALVDAITAIRYVIIFLGAYLLTRFRPGWLKENFGHRAMIGKSVATLLVAAGLVLLGLRGGEAGGQPGARLHRGGEFALLRRRAG